MGHTRMGYWLLWLSLIAMLFVDRCVYCLFVCAFEEQ